MYTQPNTEETTETDLHHWPETGIDEMGGTTSPLLSRPEDKNRLWNINRLQSFRCAFAGIWHTLKTQRNAQIHCAIAALTLLAGLFLKLSLAQWAILVLTMGFVIVTEMLNTAIEISMDYVTTDYQPQIKIIKDVAAGAVLIAAITAVIVGLLILGPPLLRYLLSLL